MNWTVPENLLLFQDLQTGSFRSYLPKLTLFYAKEVFLLFILEDLRVVGGVSQRIYVATVQ